MVIIKPHDVGEKDEFPPGVLWATGGCHWFISPGKTKSE